MNKQVDDGVSDSGGEDSDDDNEHTYSSKGSRVTNRKPPSAAKKRGKQIGKADRPSVAAAGVKKQASDKDNPKFTRKGSAAGMK